MSLFLYFSILNLLAIVNYFAHHFIINIISIIILFIIICLFLFHNQTNLKDYAKSIFSYYFVRVIQFLPLQFANYFTKFMVLFIQIILHF